MPPRRPRSSSNVSASAIPRAPTSSPQLRKQFAASIDSIYQNNITVLKRRDPSIVAILDQFSHVCLYHFNGKKWEKQGFEGSMFLVEHQEYPPYGMFILNRMGTGDYERRIYPEDDLEVLGDYLMYRFYPDYTKRRLEMNLPFPLPPQYKPHFDKEFSRDNSLPEQAQAEDSKREKKGNSVTLGLWMFPTDAREPLKDVMIRLHSYVRRGEAYPEQFRYGPSRPPPPNPHLSRANHPSQAQHSREGSQTSSIATAMDTTASHPVLGQSEVDKLFAKLQPPPQSQPIPASSVAPSIPAPAPPRSPQSWFAALAGQDMPSHGQPTSSSPAPILHSAPQQLATSVTPATSTRGLALLSSIFASVSHPGDADVNGTSHVTLPGSVSQPPPTLPPHPEDIQIVSPKPQSTALPQILNQNVIYTLLGLTPESGSRSSSAAPSSNSSRRSAANRYEGDNEMSENELPSQGNLSSSSTILEPRTDQVPPGASALSSTTHPGSEGRTPNASVQGDVTPRAAYGAGPTSPAPGAQRTGQQFLTATSITTTTVTSAQGSTVSASSSTTDGGARSAPRARALVPFTTDSELWPYPRAPLNDNEPAEGDADVVELDFSDTRALSDPTIFKEKQTKQQGKGERKKKTKKERAAEREKERDAIENGWDDPTKGQVTISGTTTIISNGGHISTTSSSTAVTNGEEKKQTINGASPSSAGPSHGGLNGAVSDTTEQAHVALLAALTNHPNAPSRDLTRKQFVQELLGLIYSDSSFVDRLYQEYTRSNS